MAKPQMETHKRQGLRLLKQLGFGVPKAKIPLTSEMIEKIINDDDDNTFKLLDESGQHFKNSAGTRSTGHKEMDFSSVQSTSHLNYTKFRHNILLGVEIPSNDDEDIDEEVQDQIIAKTTKIWKLLYKLLTLIKGDKELYKLVNDELRKPAPERKRDFSKVLEMLQIKYHFDANRVVTPEAIDKFKKKAGKKVRKCAKSTLEFMDKGSALECFANVPGTFLQSMSPVGAVGPAVGTSIGACVLLGCGINAFILKVAGGKLAQISEKKIYIQIQEGLTKAIREITDLKRYILHNLKKEDKDDKIVITEEIKDMFVKFLHQQKKIWKPYITVAGRGYHELSEEKGSETSHWTSGRRELNRKTDVMGIAKERIGKYWYRLEVAD